MRLETKWLPLELCEAVCLSCFRARTVKKTWQKKTIKKYSYNHDIFYWLESASQDFADLTDTHEKSAADLWMIHWF